MNYHNSICRLSAQIQFHSKINEQLLGRNQRQCAVTPGPLWVSGTLKDQPLAAARQRAAQGANTTYNASKKAQMCINTVAAGSSRVGFICLLL